MNEHGLILQNAPHVRTSESLFTVMGEMIVAMAPLYVIAWFYYGPRALLLGLTGAATAWVLDMLSVLACGRRPDLRDLSAVVTGLLIPLLMPASIPYYVVVTACIVAILAVKFPFGGTGNNLFNPAAVGFAFTAICWPELVFSYPAPMQELAVAGEVAAKTAVSPAHNLMLGAIPSLDLFDMILGNAAGPMGATNILVILACGLYLLVRRTIGWRAPLSFLLVSGLMAMMWPRSPFGTFSSVGWELCSGMLLFGVVFMITEPVTSPKRDFAKVLYGATSGAVVMLFRYFGGFEDGFVFALILMNVFAPLFDRVCENVLHKIRHGTLLPKNLAPGAENPPKEKKKLPKPSLKKKTETEVGA